MYTRSNQRNLHQKSHTSIPYDSYKKKYVQNGFSINVTDKTKNYMRNYATRKIYSQYPLEDPL